MNLSTAILGMIKELSVAHENSSIVICCPVLLILGLQKEGHFIADPGKLSGKFQEHRLFGVEDLEEVVVTNLSTGLSEWIPRVELARIVSESGMNGWMVGRAG